MSDIFDPHTYSPPNTEVFKNISEAFGSPEEQRTEEKQSPQAIDDILQQLTAVQSSFTLAEAPTSDTENTTPTLTNISDSESASCRSLQETEIEGIFQDVDGDGIPDYCDVTGRDSVSQQEAVTGNSGNLNFAKSALGSLKSAAKSVLGMDFRAGPKSSEVLQQEENKKKESEELGRILQATMMTKGINPLTTAADVSPSMRDETIQKKQEILQRTQNIQKSEQIGQFYENLSRPSAASAVTGKVNPGIRSEEKATPQNTQKPSQVEPKEQISGNPPLPTTPTSNANAIKK